MERLMPTDQTFNIILAALGNNKEYKALELLEELKKSGIGESEIKEAVAYLINDHQVELTPERRLRAIAGQVHA